MGSMQRCRIPPIERSRLRNKVLFSRIVDVAHAATSTLLVYEASIAHDERPCSTVRSSFAALPELRGGGYSERPEVSRLSTERAARWAAIALALTRATPAVARSARWSNSDGMTAAAASSITLVARRAWRALASAPAHEVQCAVCCAYRSSKYALSRGRPCNASTECAAYGGGPTASNQRRCFASRRRQRRAALAVARKCCHRRAPGYEAQGLHVEDSRSVRARQWHARLKLTQVVDPVRQELENELGRIDGGQKAAEHAGRPLGLWEAEWEACEQPRAARASGRSIGDGPRLEAGLKVVLVRGSSCLATARADPVVHVRRRAEHGGAFGCAASEDGRRLLLALKAVGCDGRGEAHLERDGVLALRDGVVVREGHVRRVENVLKKHVRRVWHVT
eukprot:scaffold196797_cov28-Tisochrysis_lutea.AAC.2